MHFYLISKCAVLAICGTFHPASGTAQSAVSYELTDGRTVAPLESFRECDHCPEMIVMPLGSFLMGATPEESRNPFDFYGENATGQMRGLDEVNIIPSEHPRHRVEIDVPFAIGRNEVTHIEWTECVNGGGCSHVPDHRALTLQGYINLGPDHPVVDVSYLDTLEYITWLNGAVGHNYYRLPTHAEWEYAARAGTETRFAQGDELTAAQANFSRAATENLRQLERPEGMPELVNRDQPVRVNELDAVNGWGLRHMSGNVRELTVSCWTEQQLGLAKASAYLQRSLTETSCRRVAKGGAFSSAMDGLRPAAQARPSETRRTGNQGFRIIREMNRE